MSDGPKYTQGRPPSSKADIDAIREYQRAVRRLEVANEELARRGLIEAVESDESAGAKAT